MLENLSPKRVFYYFEELTKIPRESGNEKEVSEYLYNLGKSFGYETFRDEENNVVIRKPAYKGYENHDPIVLQAHMDMVCEKDENIEHDFLKDPIKLVVDGDLIKACGTTLGADDGIGVAIGLSILEDKNLKHPSLELLVTTDEERTMKGARFVKKDFIKGKKLINIDTEDEGILFSGCAGGQSIIGKLNVKYVPNEMKNTFELSVNNLIGGHSGVEIDKDRQNALKIIFEVFDIVKEISDVKLIKFEGGTKHNAIPRDAKVIFSSNEDEYNVDFSMLKEKYPLEKDMVIEIKKIENEKKVLCDGCSKKIENIVKNIPHGVYSMIEEYPNIVECSNNFAKVRFSLDTVKFEISLRSSNMKTFDEYTTKITNVLIENSASFEIEDFYKPWEYVKDSKLRDLAVKTYKDVTNKDMQVKVIHAALETAIFVETFPNMEMIAIGPDLKEVHTPNERLSISSTMRTYEFVKKLIERL